MDHNIKFNYKLFILEFLIGMCLHQIKPDLNNYLIFPLGTLMGFLGIIYYLIRLINQANNQLSSFLLRLGLTLLNLYLGMVWMGININKFKLKNEFSYLIEHKIIKITGQILGIAYLNHNKGIQLDLKIIKVDGIYQSPSPQIKVDEPHQPQDLSKIREFLHNSKLRVKWFHPNYTIAPGDIWQLGVKLRKPHNFATLGSFDLEKYYFSHSIKMLGVVLPNFKHKVIQVKNYACLIHKFRWKLIKYFTHLTNNWNLTHREIIFALALGVKPNFSKSDLNIFALTGTSHLLAISGLHLGIIIKLIFNFSSFIWKKFAPKVWLEKITSAQLGASISIMATISYAGIAGLNLPVIRAAIMALGSLGAMIFKIATSTTKFYWLALMVVLILEPFSTLNVTFWLSFVTTGIVLYSFNYTTLSHQKNVKYAILSSISNFLYCNWLMFAGIMAINLWFFGQVYAISYFANFIAIPWVNLLILPAILVGMILSPICILGKFFLIFTDVNIELLFNLLKLLIQFNSQLILTRYDIKWLEFILALTGSLGLLLPRGLINKYLALIMFIPIFSHQQTYLKEGEVKVTILDVGQGLGVVIRLKDHIILYDVGPNNSVMANYLKYSGINVINTIIISHTDSDHIGGIFEVLQQADATTIFTNIPDYKILDKSTKLCSNNISWKIGQIKFEFLSILEESAIVHSNKKNFKNNSSCILKMTSKDYSILYPGDITAQAEKKLIAKYNHYLKADLLLVPHHGSNSSSCTSFIDTVKPTYAIISAGYLNKYFHPHQQTLARFDEKNIKIINTIKHGSIEVTFTHTSSNNMKIFTYYPMNLKFWNYS